MESFGEYIRKLRIEKGLNQTELAAKVGLDSGGLSKVENGKKSLKEDKLVKLANALGKDETLIKNQYYSEKFADEYHRYQCSDEVFYLAEEKAKYLKSKHQVQGKLDLE